MSKTYSDQSASNFKSKSSLILLLILLSLKATAQIEDFKGTDFSKADSIADLYPHYSLKNILDLSAKLTKSLSTQQEKFRAIYRWTCNNIENDVFLFQQNKRKREKLKNPDELKEWNHKITKEVFKKLLTDQKTVCTGYAYLIRELSYHAGLNCVIVDGYGRTAQSNIGGSGVMNHSWNAIQLNGKWYLCDATWSSGAIDTEKSLFVKKFDDCYFLADPELFIRNHFPMDSSKVLLDNSPTLKEFLNRPLIYSNIYRYQIKHLVPETFDIITTKGETVSFKFDMTSDSIPAKTELYIGRSQTGNSFFSKLYKDSRGLNSIDHSFNSKGTYIVHVLLDKRYIVSYKIKVE